MPENLQLLLEKLKAGVPGITPAFGAFMSECAVFCFDGENHKSGVRIAVKTSKDTKHFEVSWKTEVTEHMKRTMNDEERTTEFGAMCMAILLTLELTEYKGFEVSKKKTGVDFWLYKEESDDLDLAESARLEISGIRHATNQNSLTSRLKLKLQQVDRSAGSGLPAYISITEFGKPEAVFIKK